MGQRKVSRLAGRCEEPAQPVFPSAASVSITSGEVCVCVCVCVRGRRAQALIRLIIVASGGEWFGG